MDLRASSSCSMAPMQALCYSASAIDAMSDGSLLSIESHRSVPAPFLTKTYQLVDDPSTDHIVSWGEDESTFVVWRPPEFARDLLPNYFKHNNFSSFVRQLNTYGFRKIVPDRWEFANEFFRKGEKHLLCEIHRRKTAQNRCSPTNSSDELILPPQMAMQPWSPLPAAAMGASPCSAALAAMAAAQHHARSMNQAAMAAHDGRTQALNVGAQCGTLSLSDENERLRRDNTLLLSELARMKKLYHDVLVYLQQQNIQLQPLGTAQNHGLHLISEISSQSSSFNHMPSSQRSLIYHSSPSMSAMQSNVESPTSRLSACAGDHAKPFVSTTISPSMPNPAMGLVMSSPTGRHDGFLLQNSGSAGGNLRNFRSPTVTTSSAVPAQSTSDKEKEFKPKSNADECKKSPPKLFGVPLQSSKKRPLPDPECDEPRFRNNVVLSKTSLTTSSSLFKNANSHSELALELKQPSIGSASSMHALWLKLKASRDEQVYN